MLLVGLHLFENLFDEIYDINYNSKHGESTPCSMVSLQINTEVLPPSRQYYYTTSYVFYVILNWGRFQVQIGENTPILHGLLGVRQGHHIQICWRPLYPCEIAWATTE